ncbi:MAG: hypothetical protein DMF23_00510 [Verrucomicrobia bacterium]|nr:MAG: hypothetical protein DMF23_00510 [Verrucomicrobiota bacterium]
MTEEADEMSAIARSFLLGEGYSSEKMLALPPYKRQSIFTSKSDSQNTENDCRTGNGQLDFARDDTF